MIVIMISSNIEIVEAVVVFVAASAADDDEHEHYS